LVLLFRAEDTKLTDLFIESSDFPLEDGGKNLQHK
jgi:hypothetical protein